MPGGKQATDHGPGAQGGEAEPEQAGQGHLWEAGTGHDGSNTGREEKRKQLVDSV